MGLLFKKSMIKSVTELLINQSMKKSPVGWALAELPAVAVQP